MKKVEGSISNMKRYFSGMRMLDDIELKKIPVAEKMLYLYVLFGPRLDLLNPASHTSTDQSFYTRSLIFIASLFFYYIISLRSKELDKAIERYLCLSVTAVVTSYFVLIPLSFVFELIFSGVFLKEELEIIFDYFLMFYLPLFMPVSLLLWMRFSRSSKTLN